MATEASQVAEAARRAGLVGSREESVAVAVKDQERRARAEAVATDQARKAMEGKEPVAVD